MRFFLLIISLTAFTLGATAQYNCSHSGCNLKIIPINVNSFVPPSVSIPDPAYAAFSSSSNITVNFTGFGPYPQAQAAFQYAVDIWEALLPINVPIVIEANFAPLGPTVLGNAGPHTFVNNFTNSPQYGIFYPIALANTLAGFDLLPSEPDINATFSSQFSWYFGTDGNPPNGTADFVSVVLHELAHGFGYLSSFQYDDGDSSNGIECTGSFGVGCLNVPNVIFDLDLVRNSGTQINAYATNSSSMGSALVSNDVFWNGSAAVSANAGIKPRIHAPNPYESGSSISHLNESTYPAGTPNSLMTAYLFLGEAIHDPGAITLGILEDIGWPFSQCENIETVTGIVNNGFYEANNLVETNGIVIISSNATYHSGQDIDLNNGFQVVTGAEFKADIQPCGTLPRLSQPLSRKMSFLPYPWATTSAQ